MVRPHAREKPEQKIVVHPFGLAGKTRGEKPFLDDEDASMSCDESRNRRTIDVDPLKASDWHGSALGTAPVGLAKIDTEGGEYELLEHLLDTGITNRIRSIQAQFHEDVIPGANERMRAIHARLSATHRLTFQKLYV